MKDFLKDENGQVLVEYLLSVFIVVTSIAFFARNLRVLLFKVWKTMAHEIAAACPDCPAPDESQFR